MICAQCGPSGNQAIGILFLRNSATEIPGVGRVEAGPWQQKGAYCSEHMPGMKSYSAEHGYEIKVEPISKGRIEQKQ